MLVPEDYYRVDAFSPNLQTIVSCGKTRLRARKATIQLLML
jgi:hypothetical protein